MSAPHRRVDENLPPGGRQPPPKNIQTNIQSQSTGPPPSPLNPNAPAYHVVTHPIVYTARMPFFHPPYENPIDGRFCLHFDPSVQFGDYDNGTELGIEREVNQKLLKLGSTVRPPLIVEFELRTCITHIARATAPPNTVPEETPPFFCVFMTASQSHRWSEIYDDVKAVLEAEFTPKSHPECYPRGQLIIRFSLFGNDTAFASSAGLSTKSGAPGTPKPVARTIFTPEVSKSATPPTIKARYTYDDVPPSIESKLSSEPYREIFEPNSGLFGVSLAVDGQRGDNAIGTLGFFVLVTDVNTGDYIQDENGDPQIFGVTCSHVVQESHASYRAEGGSKKEPILMASVSKRDRENNYFSRKNRMQNMFEVLERLKSKAAQWVPEDQHFQSRSPEKKLEITTAYYIREHLKQQIKRDLDSNNDNVDERVVGRLYVAGGRRNVPIKGMLDDFTLPPKADNTITSDFALVRMSPAVYPQCINQFSDTQFPKWHPAAADIVRSHRTLTSLGRLEPEMVVMKAGRSSNVTFAKIPAHRLKCMMTVTDPHTEQGLASSVECLAMPFEAGATFSREGDSGAAVMDVSDGALVGMVMGGTPGDNNRSFVTPIQFIKADLKRNFGLVMELYMGHHGNIPNIAEAVISQAVKNATANAIPNREWEDGAKS